MRESDILFQAGKFWVCRKGKFYVVFKDGNVCASSVAHFPATTDGLSLATAYASYKSKH